MDFGCRVPFRRIKKGRVFWTLPFRCCIRRDALLMVYQASRNPTRPVWLMKSLFNSASY